jgi:A/G-specific adenine glycosylase
MAIPDASTLLAPLAAWFDHLRRPMPWRAADLDAPHPDPYAVLVSEIMLQQTQVATVIPYFLRWMARFPAPEALAAATEDEVHALWAGLGYYRRARLLQAAARAIAAEGWPRDLVGLQALPGLGPYTAAALDGNAFRVAARVLGLRDDPRRHAAALRDWLVPALARHGPSRLTQAVMELGATLCAPAPRCASCPLQDRCEAFRLDLQDVIPPAQPRAKVKEVALRLAAVASPQGWLLRPPAAKGLLAGLWSWPTAEGDALREGAAEPPAPFGLEGRVLAGWTQVYTHRREAVRPLVARVPPRPAPPGLVWVAQGELAALPLGRRDQRLRDALAATGAPLEIEDLAVLHAILH